LAKVRKAPSPRGGWIRAEREDWGIVDVAITFMYSGTSFAVVAMLHLPKEELS